MENTTFWLAVLAIAVGIQSLVWIGIGIAAFMAYRQLASSMERLQRDAVAPLVAHAHTALEKVEDATARIRAVDDKVRDFMTDTGYKASRAVSTARAALWPVIGIGQSAMAAFQAFNHPRRPRFATSRPGALVATETPPRLP